MILIFRIDASVLPIGEDLVAIRIIVMNGFLFDWVDLF